jgi:ribosomal protein L40E
MFSCPHCNADNRDNANFCRECGSRRSSREGEMEGEALLCPCCARRVRHSDRFCMACGEKLSPKIVRDTKVCLGCKAVLPPQAVFCFSCGEYVAKSSNRQVELSMTEVFGDDNPEFIPRYEV